MTSISAAIAAGASLRTIARLGVICSATNASASVGSSGTLPTLRSRVENAWQNATLAAPPVASLVAVVAVAAVVVGRSVVAGASVVGGAVVVGASVVGGAAAVVAVPSSDELSSPPHAAMTID